IAGDLYIAGVGLARGYHGRADLTADRFLPNPYGVAGSRLYHTGDVARYTATGQIEYLGRSDHQVKIRGFRIELGEIEAQLNRVANVRESLVIDQLNAHGEKQLVAYIVPEQAPLNPSQVRAALQTHLPAHMLPSLWVELAAMPLSPNGKVDRRQLPAPHQTLQRSQAFVAPCTPTEASLAEIWTNVLGVDQVGIHDNFFELGGDSILAIQMVARANQAGIYLTPKLIFQHQTIADLAVVASEQTTINAEQGLVSGPIALTPIQHWFFAQNQPEPHHWNLSILIEVAATIRHAWLEQAINAVIAHHDALRITFIDQGQGIEQINAEQQHVPLQLIDFANLAPHARSAALEEQANRLQASLDLSNGPLFKPIYFDYGAGQAGRLLLIAHHLVVDGLAWRIVLEDIHHAYQQLSMGQSISFPAKTSSFKQWSEQLYDYARSKTLAAEADYWLNQVPPWHPRLPVDDQAGEQHNTATTNQTLSVELTANETQALLQDVPSVYQTHINEVLLTALAVCLTEWTDESGVLIALEGHGREEIIPGIDLSRTVGWFTSLYPVYLALEPKTDLGTALKSIKEQIRQIPERGIGYGVLRYLHPDQQVRQQLAELPQAEIGFNYFGQLDQALEATPWFAPAYESAGALHSPHTKRHLLIDINGLIIDHQLRLNWTYNTQSYHQTTIEQLAASYLQALRDVIAHCQSAEAGGYTPSDFPDAEISQDDLDGFFARFA
ncbi:condensation domain-containing protein, partial [Herpetosiphon sp. NSE202]|uniref:condensation domain-containing protein n=1 Tax=Herpetosiphon sp. NSE202 TaxID=3351349 RepID=UPI00362FD447